MSERKKEINKETKINNNNKKEEINKRARPITKTKQTKQTQNKTKQNKTKQKKQQQQQNQLANQPTDQPLKGTV